MREKIIAELKKHFGTLDELIERLGFEDQDPEAILEILYSLEAEGKVFVSPWARFCWK